MSRMNLALVPVLACSLVLAMGALNYQPSYVVPAAGVAFVPQAIIVEPGLENLAPGELLERAAAVLAPEKMPWLRVQTWQKQADWQLSFEADGRLVRGPNQCARLEMTVRVGPESTTVVTVSDGVGLAHACRSAGHPAEVVTQKFTTPAQAPLAVQEIDDILNAHGCGGPHFLLKDIEETLENLRMERGLWNGKPVIRLSGSVKDNPPSKTRPAVWPRTCHLYLDARTLWPCRVEWWAADAAAERAFLFLELEFRDPEVNRPLSRDDCIRAFTYLPD